MKILQLNAWYKNWSTGKIVENIHHFLLNQGVESLVLYGKGPKYREANVTKFCSNIEPKINSVLSRITGIMYGGCYFSTRKFISILKKEKPDIIHIHCSNSFIINNYKLFSYIGANNYKVVITLHAEYLYTGSCQHSLECNQWVNGCKKCPNKRYSSRSLLFDNTPIAWKKMNRALSKISIKNRRVVAVSQWLADRASKSSTFANDNIVVIHNGVDENIYHEYTTKNYDYLRENNNQKLFLFVVPDFNDSLNDLKGCKHFIHIVRNLENNKDIIFVVVGKNKNNFDFAQYKNVIYLGEISNNQKMAELYSVCDATLLLSKRETYSMVTAESISCGTPIIGFKSGAPETIALEGWAFFFEQNDVDGICNKLNSFDFKMPRRDTGFYGLTKMGESYLSLYKELIDIDGGINHN